MDVAALFVMIINRNREFLYHSHRPHLPSLIQVAHSRHWRSAVRQVIVTIVCKVWNVETLRIIFIHLCFVIRNLSFNLFSNFFFLLPTLLCSNPGVNIQSVTVDRLNLHWTSRLLFLAMWHPERGLITLRILKLLLSKILNLFYLLMFIALLLK